MATSSDYENSEANNVAHEQEQSASYDRNNSAMPEPRVESTSLSPRKTPAVPSHASIAPNAQGGAAIEDAKLDALVALESRNELEVEQLFGRPASTNHAPANLPAHVRLPAQSDLAHGNHGVATRDSHSSAAAASPSSASAPIASAAPPPPPPPPEVNTPPMTFVLPGQPRSTKILVWERSWGFCRRSMTIAIS